MGPQHREVACQQGVRGGLGVLRPGAPSAHRGLVERGQFVYLIVEAAC